MNTETSRQERRKLILSPLVGMTLAAIGATPGIARAQGAAGDSGDWSRVLAAARTEGKVVLYSNGFPDTNAKLKAGFEAAYPGIALQITRLVGTTLATKVDQEIASGAEGGDAVITAELIWLEEKMKAGALKPPAGPAVREWPKQHLIEGAIPVLGLEPLVIAYNTNLVKTPITGYADLLRPELKGKVALQEVNSMVALALYDWIDREVDPAFFNKFAAQQPRLMAGAGPSSQAVASGEIHVTTITLPSIVTSLAASGAPVRMVVPNPSLSFTYFGAILGRGKNPNASLVLMDWLMSRAGQTAWSGAGNSASVLPGIPGALDFSRTTAFDPKRYPAGALDAYRTRWTKIFTPAR